MSIGSAEADDREGQDFFAGLVVCYTVARSGVSHHPRGTQEGRNSLEREAVSC